MSTIPACPERPEENWRRTNPHFFFVPPEEILSLQGTALESTKPEPLRFAWKVQNRAKSGDEIWNALQKYEGILGSEALATLKEELKRIVLVELGHGIAEVSQSQELRSEIEFRSQPFQGGSVVPGSAIGMALADRLRLSSPHELAIQIKSRGSERPLLVVLNTLQPAYEQSYSAVAFNVGENSRADFICVDGGTHTSVHRHSFVLGKGADVSEAWIHVGAASQEDAKILLERNVELGEKARFKDGQIFVPMGHLRLTSNVTTTQFGAKAVSGAAVIATEHAGFDYEPIQHHKVAGSETSFKLMILAAGRSQSTFQGLIAVEREASKTKALQENKNLILSKRARVDASPRLEVAPQDVICKHGSASGEVDPAQLYYLTSRGFSEDVSKSMILRGFSTQALHAFDTEEFMFAFLDATLSRALLKLNGN